MPSLPQAPYSSLLRCLCIRSLTTSREISLPMTQSVSLPHRRAPRRLSYRKFREEPAIADLDWSFAPKPRSHERFAHQQHFGLPRLVESASSCPGLDRSASGFSQMTNSQYYYSLSLRLLPSSELTSPFTRAHWNVFQNAYYDGVVRLSRHK